MKSDLDVENVIKKFIVETLSPVDEITRTTPLVQDGIVDSLNVLKLVEFVEDSYDIELEASDVLQFTTIENIARVIESRVQT